MILLRGTQEQPLGILNFRQSINLDVPDKDLMTIKGAVFCGSTPVVGAIVSDGEEVTTTDDNGYYWLGSRKYHGYVFVTQPSGLPAPHRELHAPVLATAHRIAVRL